MSNSPQFIVPPQFERNARLFGAEATEKLHDSHVMVIGLGGVGSFAAEAVSRAGIGRLTLIDFDEVCITNVNRQLQATTQTVGKSKAELMAERARHINPSARVEFHHKFFDKNTASELLASEPDLILDCIDNVTAKLFLIATCIHRQIPIVTSLGASGRLDPTQVKFAELRKTRYDPLAKAIRKNLWQQHKINLKRVSNLIGVFSEENVVTPHTDYISELGGGECLGAKKPAGAGCKIVWGNAVFVTSVFGMVVGSLAIRYLCGDKEINLKPSLKFLPGDDLPDTGSF